MIFIQNIFTHKRALLLIAGAALFLCIPSIGGAEFFRWVALVPLLFLITAQNNTLRYRAVSVWITGFLFLLFQYSMYFGLLPLDWLGINNYFLGVVIVFLLWVFVAVILTFPFLLLLLARKQPLLLIVLWPVQELLRAVLYSVVSLGRASVIGDTLTYGLLGYSAHTSPLLLALAPLFHLYGMAALFAAGNVFFFYALRKYIQTKHKIVFAVICVVAAILVFIEVGPAPAAPATQKEVEVIALQGDNPFLFGYTNDYFKNVATHYKKGITEGLVQYPNTRLLVVPESSQLVRTIAENENKTYKTIAEELLSSNTERVLVYGDYDGERNVSLVKSLSNNENQPEQETQKRLLMPLGEYQPYIVEFFARMLGKKEWVSDLLFYRNVRMSSVESHMLDTQAGALATVSCSEVFAGSIYRAIKKENPDIILHLQRLASFHGDTRVFYEGIRVSKFRAAELQKPIIGAVDGSGYSYIIDATGKIVSMGTKDSLFVHGIIKLP